MSNSYSWTPSEESHFGVDGFETADHTKLTPSQLESVYTWEAAGIRSVGMAWNRTLSPMGGQFRWEDIEKNKGTYNWTTADLFVKKIQEQGLHMLVLIHPYTAWDQPNKSNINYDKPTSLEAFKAFIMALVERYDGDGISDMLLYLEGTYLGKSLSLSPFVLIINSWRFPFDLLNSNSHYTYNNSCVENTSHAIITNKVKRNEKNKL